MNSVVVWSLVSALAGFLFGFDTVVISGAERTIQSLWGLSSWVHGVAMASALYGTVIGAMFGGLPSDRLGRKPTLVWVGVLYFVSAVWSGLAHDVWALTIARFIGGLGVGISTVASPLYISEIAPPATRGRLTGLFQLNIVLGILAAFFSNYLLEGVANDWRWMLGAEAFPALAYTLATLAIPESPRWLLLRGGDDNRRRALGVLATMEPDATPDDLEREADRIELATAAAGPAAGSLAGLRRPILLAFLIALFNQLSGINAVLYFAPRIFEMAGLGEKAALLQSIGIGFTNLVFTFIGLWLIDRLGRRTLLVIGSLGYVFSLGLCSWAFASGHERIVPACIFAFVAAHAIGQGAVIWVFIAEIFPDRFRATGQAIGCATHWLMAAALTTVFPTVVSSFAPSTVFAFFCGMMVLQLVWVLTMVPETKGVPLEELARRALGIPLEPHKELGNR
ncbi:MAG: sugar porter family MFS transporter [Planctomycetia bacterium]|nr:sugar porter family MFS transporter [Planctomycetia bacterium]